MLQPVMRADNSITLYITHTVRVWRLNNIMNKNSHHQNDKRASPPLVLFLYFAYVCAIHTMENEKASSWFPRREINLPAPILPFTPVHFLLISTSDKSQQLSIQGVQGCQTITTSVSFTPFLLPVCTCQFSPSDPLFSFILHFED